MILIALIFYLNCEVMPRLCQSPSKLLTPFCEKLSTPRKLIFTATLLRSFQRQRGDALMPTWKEPPLAALRPLPIIPPLIDHHADFGKNLALSP